jgi:hypothetical protein
MINITFGPPPTFSLVGLPSQLTEDQHRYEIRLPPCPACGRTIELDMIEVTAFGGPRTFLPGPWSCPSGCDPRYRRFVLAADRRDFESFCREQGWNARRVVFVSTFRHGDGIQAIRGCRVHPGMIHETARAHPDPELRAMIEIRFDREARWNAGMGQPFNIDLVRRPNNRPDDDVISRGISVPPDDESSRWPDAYRWIPS